MKIDKSFNQSPESKQMLPGLVKKTTSTFNSSHPHQKSLIQSSYDKVNSDNDFFRNQPNSAPKAKESLFK
jgi:hypothetical protein